MQSVAELHCDDADAHVTNALLLVINAIGIPVLAREYGEVHAPPSAAVGVLSAIHHASTKDSGASLHLLESAHRTVAYHTTEQELLLVFASDKQAHEQSVLGSHRNGGPPRMLATIGTALSVLLGSQAFADLDASKQRLALSKHADVIDYIVKNFRRDIRMLLGRPLQDLCSRGVQSAREVVKLGGSSKTGGVLSTLVLEGSESLDDHTAHISICHHDAQEPDLLDAELQTHRTNVALSDADAVSASPLPDTLLQALPPTFVCGYASRLGVASPSCRAISFMNSSWRAARAQAHGADDLEQSSGELVDRDLISNVREDVLWSALNAFVALRLDSLTHTLEAVLPLDYKREDEVFTLLHHTRGRLQFFVMCIGSLPLERTPAVGDALYAYFAAAEGSH